MHYPVIIIGGGPAGTICSLHLSEADIPHLLLESEKFPREKACADILTSNALRELTRADKSILSRIRELPSYQEIWGTYIHLEDNPRIDLPYHGFEKNPSEPSAIAIRRKELDALLWGLVSKKERCTALDELHVSTIKKQGDGYQIITRQGLQFSADLIVIAAGSHSRLIKETGFDENEADRHTALGLRAYFKDVSGLVSDRCELYLQRDTMPGGFYIAPLGDGTCNVNVVLRKDIFKRKEFNLHQVMKDFYQKDPILQGRFKDASVLGNVIGQSLHLGTKRRKKYHDSTFLCGDSGGLVDLISANGIPQAMLSGRLAASSILSIISGEKNRDAAGSWYEEELESQLAAEMKLGRVLSPFMGIDWFNRVLLTALKTAQGKGDSSFLQELLYASEPWETLKKRMNPFS